MNILGLWCLGFDIDPVVLKSKRIQQYIQEKDGVAALQELQRHAKALPGRKLPNLSDPRLSLEFISLVRDERPMLFAKQTA